MVIGTLADDGWDFAFGTAKMGLGRLWLYQMQQPTHQWPVYQLHIIQCGTIIAFALK